jgi:hypothetical protein
MCNDAAMFSDLRPIPRPLNVTLGDGQNVHAGCMTRECGLDELSHGKESCTLHDVLLVPDSEGATLLVAVYVDDIVLGGKSEVRALTIHVTSNCTRP